VVASRSVVIGTRRGAEFQIAHVEGDQLGAPEGTGEPEQQDCAVSQALQVGIGERRHGDYLVGRGRRLAHRGGAKHAANAVHCCFDHLAAGRRIVVAGKLVRVPDRDDTAADACRLEAARGLGGEEGGGPSQGPQGRREGPARAPCGEPSEAAACPSDYVAVPLLASASVLIGHARWPQATPGWAEPPHLWVAAVGDSGNGKTPGADCLMRDVLPEIERRMVADFPDRLREWRASAEFARAADDRWKDEVRAAEKRGTSAPLPPVSTAGPEPHSPRLRQNDVTVERVATLLATAAPKGLLIVRDESAGWIDGMSAYNPAGRSFWVEAYGGRPYRLERVKHPEPIFIPRLAVAVYGTTQPDKLVLLMRAADDGLLARVLWTWPDLIPFRLGKQTPAAQWAICAFDRLRELGLQPGDPPRPIMVPLSNEARELIETFGAESNSVRRMRAGCCAQQSARPVAKLSGWR
jgi:Protein of unknown function (DUF3987)